MVLVVTKGRDSTAGDLPFGVAEILAAVAGARRVLDAGCGGGRLTVALARSGAGVTGFDTSRERLGQARRRGEEAGVALRLCEADLDLPLPFADASFDAVTSRLVLMVADDPVATLRELRRTLAPGGRVATVIWASLSANPWFALPREAVGATLGADRASFARAFGELGDPDEAATVHRVAGLQDVDARLLREHRTAPDAAAYWQALADENGHFRRVTASLNDGERRALAAEVEARLEPYREGDHLSLLRTLVLVTARST
jgi:SAM-dependent methyltransferase